MDRQVHKRITKPYIPKALNPDLIGLWKIGAQLYEITSNSLYLVIQAPLPYTITEPQLNWSGWIFERVYGDPNEIPGVWRDPVTNEEYFFREDSTFTFHDPANWELFGTYRTSTSPDTLGTSEVRAVLTENGSTLIFDITYGPSLTYDFVVTTTTLTLTDPNTMQQTIYTRVT